MTNLSLPQGLWLGRVRRAGISPSLVTLRAARVIDITTKAAPAMSDLPKLPDIAGFVANVPGCDLGPFIRLFGADFTLDTVLGLDLSLTITGEDGFVLCHGTMFLPVQDRDGPGQGFTHHLTISAPGLGALTNTARLATETPEWQFGTAALMRNLAGRGLLQDRAFACQDMTQAPHPIWRTGRGLWVKDRWRGR